MINNIPEEEIEWIFEDTIVEVGDVIFHHYIPGPYLVIEKTSYCSFELLNFTSKQKWSGRICYSGTRVACQAVFSRLKPKTETASK